ncbi:aldose 1-epimerase family protein [Christensenella timonensis]|uniref:aldose 1-epimerase family protein n=1 Tax=Christensenella timonensis TaxID=1816678 RepID=UPI0008332969|nr:aldose 1-epimerase family protein [Christensenella timonensis]
MRIRLTNGGMCADIDTHGAQLTSLRGGDGTKYIWEGAPDFWAESAPILFPIVCDVRNNETLIEGKRYHMERHGFVKDMEFTVVLQERDKAVLTLEASPKTLEQYPYRFRLSVSYVLRMSGIDIVFDVQNLDDKTMYYQLGVHPGFCCPLHGAEAFEDYELRFSCHERLTTPLLNAKKRLIEKETDNFRLDGDVIPLAYGLFEQDALVFDTLKSRRVELVHSRSGQGVRVSFPDFQMLGVWTPAGKEAPFVCIEPWNGTATYEDEGDELCRKRGIQSLEKEKSKDYRMWIGILADEKGK